ncbi:hypothetical protein [Kaistella yonginensis]|uniref:hypothetical protein n=1 Tax=Kaistella yonginensis TaxID=658267 RepID=UPI0025B617AD|nr:hypothetical protein [Kaistella yonginensis]MDN3607754.1 hypothetical protein [Kaistella yonginensis]
MKTIKMMTVAMSLLLVASCASSVKFPISPLVPAAEITAVKKKTVNNNFDIEVTANYLANPNRLSPARNFYVVWIVTDKNEVKNIGQLIQNRTRKVVLKTTTPFNVKEIFITAEDRGDITSPIGTEITRKKW